MIYHDVYYLVVQHGNVTLFVPASIFNLLCNGCTEAAPKPLFSVASTSLREEIS